MYIILNKFLSKGQSTAPKGKIAKGGGAFLKHLGDLHNYKESVFTLSFMSNISPQNNHLFCFKPQSWLRLCIVGAEDDIATSSNQYKHARSDSASLDFLFFFIYN